MELNQTDEDAVDSVDTTRLSLHDMADEVHGLFFREGWSFGEYEYPSEEDIHDIVERCVVHLTAQSPGTMIEVANLAVRKEEDGQYEIYVKLGVFDG